MRVGQRVREIRLEKRVGLRELARALPVSHATLAEYESGQVRVDADLLPKIAEALGVSPCVFFEEAPTKLEPTVEAAVQRTAEVAARKVAEGLERRLDAIAEGVAALERRLAAAAPVGQPTVEGRPSPARHYRETGVPRWKQKKVAEEPEPLQKGEPEERSP